MDRYCISLFRKQQRIVAKVQQLQQQLSQLESRLQQSNTYAHQLLQTVLQQAFEGNVYKMEEDKLRIVAEGVKNLKNKVHLKVK